MSIRLLRNALNSLVPNWAANAPGANTLFKVVYATALVGDCLLEGLFEGTLALMPGLGTPTALPLLGQSRGLLQGLYETNASFDKRLLAWLDLWIQAGSAEILATNLQAILTRPDGSLLTIRILDRSGNAVTAAPDGTTSFSTVAGWNWDDTSGWVDGAGYHSGAIVSGYWSDMWIVIAPDPYPHYTSFSDPNWLAMWFTPFSGNSGIGHVVPNGDIDAVMATIQTWKGAHTFFRAIVWCADVTAFVPSGSYGNNSIVVNGAGQDGRDSTNRYWEPALGG